MSARLILFSLLFCCTLLSAAEKMCWAHYVGWGFNQVDRYDHAALNPGGMLAPFYDRTLLGRNLQWDTGIFFGARRQIDAARAYGFDGFCVDIVDPKSYIGGLKRFYKDAEGTGFKIALCIDRLDFSNDYLVEHLGNFIKTYKDHPNNSYIDGKMVIFVYNPRGKNVDEWIKVRKTLADQGLDAYYIAQPMHETSLWDNPAELKNILRGYESLYDFGCNGFTPEEMKQRLANGRAALKENRPDGMLVGGIAVGYIGVSSGFYRPFLNSGTLRQNWEAAIANDADWVCITTWNDYGEQTQFEPTVLNRDALLLINREYLARWRGTSLPVRTPRVIYSYHEEVVAGDDLTIEVLSFSYTTPQAKVLLRMLDESGKEFHSFPAIELARKELTVNTLRLPGEQLENRNIMRLQAALVSGTEQPEYKELYSIVRRPGRIESVRTVRVRHDDLTPPPVSLSITGNKAKISVNSWVFAGKYELLRNGYPVAEEEISHEKKPVFETVTTLPAIPRSTFDVYLVRLTDASGRVGFSNPVVVCSGEFSGKTLQPIIATGSDFDENWPLWKKRISRFPQNRIEQKEVAEHEVFRIRYDFTEGEGTLLTASGWSIPAQLGNAPHYGWHVVAEALPQWKKGTGPGGEERMLLAFDGKKSNISLASRTLPYGPMTLELWIKPQKKGESMILFHDPAGFTLSLDAELRPQLERLKDSLKGTQQLPADRWSHLAVTYTGDKLQIFLDGKLIGESPAATRTMPINSLPRIGNRFSLDNGYLGEMAGVSLEGALRAPNEFRLLNR